METPRQKILQIITQSSEDVTRREIAAALGKTRLNPNDILILESLVFRGLVQADKHLRPGYKGYEWTYRA